MARPRLPTVQPLFAALREQRRKPVEDTAIRRIERDNRVISAIHRRDHRSRRAKINSQPHIQARIALLFVEAAEPALVIPFDPQLFGLASNNGQMLGEVQPNAPASEAMRQLAEMVTGRAVSQPAKKNGLSFLPFLNKKTG